MIQNRNVEQFFVKFEWQRQFSGLLKTVFKDEIFIGDDESLAYAYHV